MKMKRKIIQLGLVAAVLIIAAMYSPNVMPAIADPVSDSAPASEGINPVTDEAMNSLDSSGGEDGWSPVIRYADNSMGWDTKWTSHYRHNDNSVTTTYGAGTQLDADGNDPVSGVKGFYQYLMLSIGDIGEYTLHLDFYLREDSSSTISSVDNWYIYIFDSKASTLGEKIWGRGESHCDEHGVYRQQIFDLNFTSPTLYVVIGHGDGWSADWSQGHTKCFNDITVIPATPIETHGPSTEEVLALEDCYVNSLYDWKNYDNRTLKIRDANLYDNVVYLKFSLYGIRDITSATLKLFCTSTGLTVDQVKCSGFDGDSWSETSMTWDSQPEGTLQELDETAPYYNNWQEWDITPWAQSHENMSEITLVLSTTNESLWSASYYSKENAVLSQDSDLAPRLVITGDYDIVPVETFEVTRSVMIANFILYDPPGSGSYQSMTHFDSRTWTMELGVEFNYQAKGAGVSMATEVDYGHEWGYTRSQMTYFASNTEDIATGVDGDTVVGRVVNITYEIHVYKRVGYTWEFVYVRNTKMIGMKNWIDTAVVSRGAAEDAPFEVPEIPVMKHIKSSTMKSVFSGGDIPLTHTVTRTFTAGDTFGVKAGIYAQLDIGGGMGSVEYTLQFTCEWSASSETTIETEFTLYDPDGVWCNACTQGPIDMTDRNLDTQSFLFWFNY